MKIIKSLSKKQKIVIIVSIMLILLLIGGIITLKSINKKKMQTQTTSNQLKDSLVIPTITAENTIFNVQTLEEGKKVTIKIDKKLDEYNIYYLIQNISNNVEDSTSENTTGQTVDKNDFSNYTLFENELNIIENCSVFFIYEKEGKYSSDTFEMKIINIVESFEEEATQEEIDAAKVDANSVKTGKAPYYIKVNYGANVVTVYGKDDNGNYTVPVKAMVCSCGTGTPRSGTYKTSRGYQWGSLFGGVYGMYSTRIVGHILFHSVPYTAPSNDCLEWWEFDKLGTKASMGCIRLQVKDSKWIYDNCSSGTFVEFYSSSDPGPLGKPSAPKISNNEQCRNWDPTDPNPGNPWFNQEEEITPEDIISGNIITDDTILND